MFAGSMRRVGTHPSRSYVIGDFIKNNYTCNSICAYACNVYIKLTLLCALHVRARVLAFG